MVAIVMVISRAPYGGLDPTGPQRLLVVCFCRLSVAYLTGQLAHRNEPRRAGNRPNCCLVPGQRVGRRLVQALHFVGCWAAPRRSRRAVSQR
ncbi:hypothetical protein AB0F73_00875 [Micromonospora purpureochromogenes]|uniref:hypothetical protein n=1 Tax=Micromonospora purpureochromogenes TaxID=47872 RepID=UPI0033F3EB52